MLHSLLSLEAVEAIVDVARLLEECVRRCAGPGKGLLTPRKLDSPHRQGPPCGHSDRSLKESARFPAVVKGRGLGAAG